MRFSSFDTARAIADAMLAGAPEPETVAAQIAATLGVESPWMHAAVLDALDRFGNIWDDASPDALAELIAAHPGFVAAWQRDDRPQVIRIIRRAPQQVSPPQRLAHIGIPHLPTLGDLADWLEVTPDDLGWLANRWRVGAREAGSPVHHYLYRAREKRNGRYRLIERPKALLRATQHKLLHGLIDHVTPHEAAHGFRKGRNIVSFAAPHANRPLVMRFDLEDFFASVKEARIHALFRTLGYPVGVTRALSALVTNRVPSALLASPEMHDKFDRTERERLRERHLPQGASTSPALANLCAFRLDTRLAALARSMNATYTRYADDLAFSGTALNAARAGYLQRSVFAIALEEGFTVQPRKTRIMPEGVRQRLAGVVVNRHPNLARDEFDRLKAILTNCVRQGPTSQNREGHAHFRASLEGRVAHASMLNGPRGAKLRAIFDSIDWNDESREP
jgi:RNA-directed DNA polymerase